MARFDHSLLRGKIAEKGLSQGKLAKHLGISETTMSKKMRSESDFTVTEVSILMYLLGIEDPKDYFFKQ